LTIPQPHVLKVSTSIKSPWKILWIQKQHNPTFLRHRSGRVVYYLFGGDMSKNCWMCAPKEYRYLKCSKEKCNKHKVDRLIDENEHCYVVVPSDPLFRHHIMIVLKKRNKEHKKNLIECTKIEITQMGEMIAKWCGIFKRMKYDTVYSGCFSDSGHVHTHLYPFNFEIDKIYKGNAISWLSCKERTISEVKFEKLSHDDQVKRIELIRKIVKTLVEHRQL
jgi:diadenosine tetraphosphate (Ap4A) HIT family hydrolase